MKLVSFNGEKEHVSMLPLPELAWLGRLRARLEFTRQCRVGTTEVVVQTMRPELGPRVVDLTSTFMRIDEAFDGEKMVEASVWAVQISDVSRHGYSCPGYSWTGYSWTGHSWTGYS